MDGVEQDRKQRSGEGDEDHRQFRGWEHQHRERNPGHGGNGSNQLERWQEDVVGEARTTDGEPEADTHQGRRGITAENALEARGNMLEELGGMGERPGGLDRIGRRGYVAEADEAEIEP